MAKSMAEFLSPEYELFNLYHLDLSDMKPVTIAVIDNGINLNIPYFQKMFNDGLLSIYNLTNEKDINGDHGTHMSTSASLIIDNNRNRLHGLINLIVIKVMNKMGYGDSKAAIEAIDIAVGNDADIINFSFGTEERDEAFEAKCIDVANQGILINAAGGNDEGFSVDFPGSTNGVNAVGSFGLMGTNEGVFEFYHSKFSDQGAELNTSCVGEFITGFWDNGALVSISGTSSAAAISTRNAAILHGKGYDVHYANWVANAYEIGDPHKFGAGVIYPRTFANILSPEIFKPTVDLSKNQGCNFLSFLNKSK